ncbi:MAG: hypothetical protein LBT05_10660 [Planctomycetaceae bacterium]|jgi:hypothetical protein|nr:hypothetical protein [Planctomycetaceae bacterium]
MKKILLVFQLLLCIALIVGCGTKRPPGFPTLVGCVLTIQYEDGSPVDKAIVSLAPEDAELRQWSISGTTNASGVVNIRTNGDFAGAPAGKYKVVVRKTEAITTGEKDVYGDPITGSRALVAEEFSNSQKTPLSLEIGSSSVKETLKVKKGDSVNPISLGPPK